MLGKLLKYEMQAMGRILMPLYGVLLVLSVAFGLSLRQSNQYNTGNQHTHCQTLIAVLLHYIENNNHKCTGRSAYLITTSPQ